MSDTYVYTEVATAASLIYQESATGAEIALAAGLPRGSRRDYAFVSGDPDDCHRIAKQYDGRVYQRTLRVGGVRMTLYVCALPGGQPQANKSSWFGHPNAGEE